ncbi:hypothetical protein MMC17_007558 [Xylographa soralifera]|nr:hypothetical protein [Xylographa soralifera]
MSSYLSSLTSQYTSLKRLLPTSLSEDQDRSINSESDSHVTRVLRAYYTEKGRPFPAWLGPDPNASSRSTIAALSNAPATTGAGSLRAGRGGPPATGGGGLGDLFADSSPQGGSREAESLSLRQRRPGMRSPGFKGGSSDSIPYPQKVAQAPQSQHMRSSSSSSTGDVSASLPPNVRPLPSQREGSYQSRLGMISASSNTSAPSTSSNGSYSKENTVQERLKARLGGSKSRGASPIFGGSSTPDPPSSSGSGGGEYDPYSSTNYNVGGSGSFNPYESNDGRASKKNPYASASDSRPQYATNNAGSSKIGNSGTPYMAATSPWVSGDDGYRSGSASANRGAPSNSQGGGLPGSLLPGRRGPTLPDSPRRRGL